MLSPDTLSQIEAQLEVYEHKFQLVIPTEFWILDGEEYSTYLRSNLRLASELALMIMLLELEAHYWEIEHG